MGNDKKNILVDVVKHFDITKIDAVPIINAWRDMGFSSRSTAEQQTYTT